MEAYMKIIEAAVNYWANFFTNTPYGDRANSGQLNGLESALMTLAKMSANSEVNITDDQITKFKELFTSHLVEYAKMKRDCTIDTDWAPEWPLSDFLFKSGIPNTLFPSKTMMWVKFSTGEVKVEENIIFSLASAEKNA